MAVRDAFSMEEWRTVSAAPFLVGLYLVGASQCGPMGIVTEMLAAEKAVTLEASQPDALPIVQEIEADLVAEVLTRDFGLIDGSDETQARVLGELTLALALVKTHSPGLDSAFRAWLFRVAEHVARASAEGPPGDRRVIGDHELDALHTLAGLLGVPR